MQQNQLSLQTEVARLQQELDELKQNFASLLPDSRILELMQENLRLKQLLEIETRPGAQVKHDKYKQLKEQHKKQQERVRQLQRELVRMEDKLHQKGLVQLKMKADFEIHLRQALTACQLTFKDQIRALEQSSLQQQSKFQFQLRNNKEQWKSKLQEQFMMHKGQLFRKETELLERVKDFQARKQAFQKQRTVMLREIENLQSRKYSKELNQLGEYVVRLEEYCDRLQNQVKAHSQCENNLKQVQTKVKRLQSTFEQLQSRQMSASRQRWAKPEGMIIRTHKNY